MKSIPIAIEWMDQMENVQWQPGYILANKNVHALVRYPNGALGWEYTGVSMVSDEHEVLPVYTIRLAEYDSHDNINPILYRRTKRALRRARRRIKKTASFAMLYTSEAGKRYVKYTS